MKRYEHRCLPDRYYPDDGRMVESDDGKWYSADEADKKIAALEEIRTQTRTVVTDLLLTKFGYADRLTGILKALDEYDKEYSNERTRNRRSY